MADWSCVVQIEADFIQCALRNDIFLFFPQQGKLESYLYERASLAEFYALQRQ